MGWADEPGSVAVVGSRSFLGRCLLHELAQEDPPPRVLALDLRPPARLLPGQSFHSIDLTRPAADRELAELFVDEEVKQVVHLALLDAPSPHSAYAHELDVIGTLHLLAAAREAGVRSFLLRSTTLVYGAELGKAALLDESQQLRGSPSSPFLRDKREVEAELARFAAAQPQVQVGVLRFAPLLGQQVSNCFQRYFRLPLAPTPAGRDPLVQALHEEDAARALFFALRHRLKGRWNVAAPGSLSLAAALHLAGSRPLPLPRALLLGGSKALASLGLLPEQGPAFMDFLRSPPVADVSKLLRAGFSFTHDLSDTFRDLHPKQNTQHSAADETDGSAQQEIYVSDSRASKER